MVEFAGCFDFFDDFYFCLCVIRRRGSSQSLGGGKEAVERTETAQPDQPQTSPSGFLPWPLSCVYRVNK